MGVAGADSAGGVDEAELYGIDSAVVQEFESQGFEKGKIVEVLRRLGVKTLRSGR